MLEYSDGKLRASNRLSTGDAELRCLALSPDEQAVAVGTETGRLILAGVPECDQQFEAQQHVGAVTAVDFAASGLLASGARDGVVRLWQRDGQGLRELLAPRHARPVRHLEFGPDGVHLTLFRLGFALEKATTGQLARMPHPSPWWKLTYPVLR